MQQIVSNYMHSGTHTRAQARVGEDIKEEEREVSERIRQFLQREEVQGSLLIAVIIAAVLIIKAFTVYCPLFTFITDEAAKDAIYVLFREVAIVLVVLILLLQLQYYKIISF